MLDRKEKSEDEADNLTKILHLYPLILDSADLKYKGAFTTTIDKTTKAIKLHSITTRPQRDPNKRLDEEYRQWLRQKEFNPFLVNTWMLLAKAEFEEGSYLRAITTFMHITKIYPNDAKIVCECKLWIARAYSEMGWGYEADDVLRKLEQTNGVHPDLKGMYASVKANILVRNGNYAEAIPLLEESIAKEKRGNQKRRKRYLLGQLYAQTGENQKAYQAFGKARGMTAPYKYTINSKLRQLEVANIDKAKKVSSLQKMAKKQSNEDYLDQVYTIIGDVYMEHADTLEAIKNYALAIEKSKNNGYDKALAEVKLGGLYFSKKEYVKAQPCYSGALSELRKDDEFYPLVSLRSEVLDQLVVYAKVVQEQDSLLHLASLPEDERLAIINTHIDELKKEKRRQEQEARRSEAQAGNQVISWDDLGGNNTPIIPNISSQGQESDFYFYQENTVKQGKIAFQKNWGRRPLEDNWRRSNKTTQNPFGTEEELLAVSDSLNANHASDSFQEDGQQGEALSDIYSVEYYLQQLPLSEQAKNASYKLVDDGLYNMGLIYKDLLEDDALAIEAFEQNMKRFPESEYREAIYYQMFLIYLRLGNQDLAANYRNKIIKEFPESEYTVPLSDPNYAWNFTHMGQLQEEIYQKTYDAYFAGDVNTVRHNYREIQTKFPFVSLMPKFALLNSLSYALTKDAKSLEQHLNQLIVDYPQSDVVPLATSILRNIRDGKILLSDGTPITGLDWNMAYSNDSIFEGENAMEIKYLTDLDKPYVLLLMFRPKSIDRNELLYEVADYNFSNYVIQTFDLNYNADEAMSALEIKGFQDFKSLATYLTRAMASEGLLTKLEKDILPVPISMDNYTNMFPRLGLDNYMAFYTDSLSSATPKLLAYWDKDQRDQLLASIAVGEKADETVTDEHVEVTPNTTVVPEAEGERIEFSQEQRATAEPKTLNDENDKEVNLEDVLSKNQVAIIADLDQKTDDIIEGINQLGSNPVEGLKNIFNRKKIEDNLTKEEKEELKKEKKAEKELQKAEKAKMDALNKVEKQRIDSINRAEKLRIDSIKHVERAHADSVKAIKKANEEKIKREKEIREEEIRQRDQERKQLIKEREERRKQQEKSHKEKLKQRDEERKRKEKEAEDLRKKREQERKQQLKERGR